MNFQKLDSQCIINIIILIYISYFTTFNVFSFLIFVECFNQTIAYTFLTAKFDLRRVLLETLQNFFKDQLYLVSHLSRSFHLDYILHFGV